MKASSTVMATAVLTALITVRITAFLAQGSGNRCAHSSPDSASRRGRYGRRFGGPPAPPGKAPLCEEPFVMEGCLEKAGTM